MLITNRWLATSLTLLWAWGGFLQTSHPRAPLSLEEGCIRCAGSPAKARMVQPPPRWRRC
jgi:hypothetical protein